MNLRKLLTIQRTTPSDSLDSPSTQQTEIDLKPSDSANARSHRAVLPVPGSPSIHTRETPPFRAASRAARKISHSPSRPRSDPDSNWPVTLSTPPPTLASI